MNVKKRLEKIEKMMLKMVGESSEVARRQIYNDAIGQLHPIREDLGLPVEECPCCGLDGMYECVRCQFDYCGGCCEEVEDGFLCHDCKESGSPRGWVLEAMAT